MSLRNREDEKGALGLSQETYLKCCRNCGAVMLKPRGSGKFYLFSEHSGSGEKPTGHPRTFGTFTRVLGRYVREKNLISLESAVRKMTYLPAMVYNLAGKGLIREGMDADLVLFDPETVADLGDYVQPARGNVGIEYVLVNGKIAVKNNKATGVLAGKPLFREKV